MQTPSYNDLTERRVTAVEALARAVHGRALDTFDLTDEGMVALMGSAARLLDEHRAFLKEQRDEALADLRRDAKAWRELEDKGSGWVQNPSHHVSKWREMLGARPGETTSDAIRRAVSARTEVGTLQSIVKTLREACDSRMEEIVQLRSEVERAERVLGWWREIGRDAAIAAHERGDLSEGQASTMLDMDRVTVREAVDTLRVAPPRESRDSAEDECGKPVDVPSLVPVGCARPTGHNGQCAVQPTDDDPDPFVPGKTRREASTALARSRPIDRPTLTRAIGALAQIGLKGDDDAMALCMALSDLSIHLFHRDGQARVLDGGDPQDKREACGCTMGARWVTVKHCGGHAIPAPEPLLAASRAVEPPPEGWVRDLETISRSAYAITKPDLIGRTRVMVHTAARGAMLTIDRRDTWVVVEAEPVLHAILQQARGVTDAR